MRWVFIQSERNDCDESLLYKLSCAIFKNSITRGHAWRKMRACQCIRHTAVTVVSISWRPDRNRCLLQRLRRQRLQNNDERRYEAGMQRGGYAAASRAAATSAGSVRTASAMMACAPRAFAIRRQWGHALRERENGRRHRYAKAPPEQQSSGRRAP